MTAKILTLALALSPFAAHAAETDHYTLPPSEVPDVTYEINDFANSNVAKVLERLNREGRCDAPEETGYNLFPGDAGEAFKRAETNETRLYKGLRTIFANHGSGRLVDELLSGNLPRTILPLKQSVYSDWEIGTGFLLGREGAASSPLALSPLIRVGGLLIGVDKLEHMFGMGYAYFDRYHLREMNLKTVLKIGVAAEKTYLGGNMFATGVFTYADLAANFNGMRFWNHMLQKDDDVLGKEHNYGPYITCDKGQWRQNPERPIDFTRYVDQSMQEDVNCSKFATQKGLDKFRASLDRLTEKYGKSRSFTCPVSRSALEEIISKYAIPMKDGETIDHWLINRDGNGKVSYLNEF